METLAFEQEDQSMSSLHDTSMVDDVDISSMQQVTPPSKATGYATSYTHSKAAPLSKRQQAAHRARTLALSKQLQTRLQYAVFKVEHGWSKQTLSEVENLFYKHRRASGSGASPSAAARTSPSASRAPVSGAGSRSTLPAPSTPGSSWRTSPMSKGQQERKASVSGGPIGEAMGGLVTPPTSGGTMPSSHDRYMFGARPSFASGLSGGSAGGQQSPSLASMAAAANTGKGGSGGANPSSANRKSYADFWSKIGGAGTTQAPPPNAEGTSAMSAPADQ